MRGLKKADPPIISGYRIFHNYVRPHEGLVGKTPAEAGGIKVKGDNKWITLIQNAKLSFNLYPHMTQYLYDSICSCDHKSNIYNIVKTIIRDIDIFF